MRKPAKNAVQEKHNAVPRQPSLELTCSESQVEDLLSAGESTEEERNYSEHSESKPVASSSGGLNKPVAGAAHRPNSQ
jgi:hypothetical protein